MNESQKLYGESKKADISIYIERFHLYEALEKKERRWVVAWDGCRGYKGRDWLGKSKGNFLGG